MRKQIYWVIRLQVFTILLFVCFAVSADIQPEVKQAFHHLITRYMEYFNTRNPDGIISMYADDPMIKTKIKGKEKYISKEEFMARLPDEINEWKKKKQKLVDFKIEELEVNGDLAKMEIEFRGKQGIFSGRLKGNIEAKKVGPDWKIVVDEF